MATKLTDLVSTLTNPASDDLLHIVDVSDSTGSAQGTSKKIDSKYIIQTDKLSLTNTEVKNIDTAVLRRGRTFDILELRPLSNSEAKKIWLDNNLTEELFIENFNNTEVLQADLGSLITITKKANEQNIELKPYIYEDGISLYNKIKNPKKLGL